MLSQSLLRGLALRWKNSAVNQTRGSATFRVLPFLSLLVIITGFVLRDMIPSLTALMMMGLSWMGLLVGTVLWITSRRACKACNHVWFIELGNAASYACPSCTGEALVVDVKVDERRRLAS